MVLLSLYLLETDSINVRKGIFNPIDESFDINDHERISEFIPTAQSTFKYRTQQKYQGIPIFGAKLVFEQDNDKMEPSSLENDFVQPVFGKYVNKQQLSNKIPSVQPQLSKDEALKYALDSISITEDKLYGNVDINLYIYFVHQDPYLSYIVKLSYHDDISIYQPMIIVNANNGDILNTYDNKKNFLDACGDGGNPKFGKVRYCGSKAFKINDGVNPVLANHYVQVYSNDNEDVFNKAQSFLIPASLNSTSGDYNIDDGVANEGYCAACDAFEFSNFVFDIFQTYLGENPVADKHIPLKAYVHVGMLLSMYFTFTGCTSNGKYVQFITYQKFVLFHAYFVY